MEGGTYCVTLSGVVMANGGGEVDRAVEEVCVVGPSRRESKTRKNLALIHKN